ncbi:hypothetical protein Patl1_13071 [Pistacia atlantica]|uniref:Uncharacterized protein n=1 Tax=Pistacia atlantica TaxID=434234 RepID=A0ACC1AV13_9ROSI|nr:hypothetical protein Patl1_13071 [Pistacia atlantica]
MTMKSSWRKSRETERRDLKDKVFLAPPKQKQGFGITSSEFKLVIFKCVMVENLGGYLQDLVYKLSKVGQAIDNNDLSTASSVLGRSSDTDWVQKVNSALTKLSPSPEAKTEGGYVQFLASFINFFRWATQ